MSLKTWNIFVFFEWRMINFTELIKMFVSPLKIILSSKTWNIVDFLALSMTHITKLIKIVLQYIYKSILSSKTWNINIVDFFGWSMTPQHKINQNVKYTIWIFFKNIIYLIFRSMWNIAFIAWFCSSIKMLMTPVKVL